MSELLISLRIVHFVFGVFWVGSAFFLTLFLEPRLKALGPAIQGPVMRALVPVVSPAMTIASVLTIGAGVAIALVMRRHSLHLFFSSAWGWAMLIAFIATVAVFLMGLVLIAPTGKRLGKMGESIVGRPPTPVEASTMARLSHRLVTISQVEIGLFPVAVGSMAAARFV